MVCGVHFCPVRVVWSDKDGERSVRLRGLNKLLAQEPALGLDVLGGLKEWEHGRRCSEVWGPSRPYKPTQWAHLGEGWLGCEDAGLWRGMVGGEAKEVKKEREEASTSSPPPPKPKPPPQERQGGQSAPGKEEEAVQVGLGR